MIPPVEVRQVRPCGFSQEIGDVCIWFLLVTDHVGVKHCERPSFHDITPCKYHITRDELLELITQHNSGEIPGWLKKKIKDRIELLSTKFSASTAEDMVSELELILSLRKEDE